ncbi:NrfD/PsrC family molybdoenzyme membrane anchor subunit [Nocardioides sp. Arc9.136]|uniref:NrfD/PsrC family molybdoenzyme membrane anchor subunit n=1 Tax=Nocardioides sp. Arc9.136 TaxID=2996826 RepID=UPI0026651540|nr:NrfD/PsrC family molybdoenzyme membrane anchor subunit [Nocardioides sp. Arc9.136]WKN49313.1 polysulfide reductase NrfD [Nocardioides sp. Arc9.136]
MTTGRPTGPEGDPTEDAHTHDQVNAASDPLGAEGDNAVGREGPQGVRSQTTATVGTRGGARGSGEGGSGRRRGGRRGGGRGGDRSMVPEAEFTSYYGRPIVKPSPWEADIPAYLFAGGLAAGSSLLAAGADLTGRPVMRRSGRLVSIGALGFSMVALVHDLGTPSRFYNMLRVAKPTSPMSMGTWILSGYGAFAGAATAAEVARMLPPRWGSAGPLRRPLALLPYVDRPAGVLAAVIAPAVASYTAVLLSDTATPSWHSAYRELPFVFVGSAAAASSGMAMVTAPVAEAGPARRLAVAGAALELVMEHRMEQTMGVTAEPLHHGTAGRLMRAAKALTVAGAAGSLLAGRSRVLSVLSGAALLAGSACTRFGVFEAGQASAKDPKYTVVPQRQRLEEHGPTRHPG